MQPYTLSLEEISAGDMEIVEDPMELRLLRAFRAAPQRQHARILSFAEQRPSPPLPSVS